MIDEEDGDFVLLVTCFFLGRVVSGWVLPDSLMLKRLRTSRRVLGLRTAMLPGLLAGGS
jgi:hypothetical protein